MQIKRPLTPEQLKSLSQPSQEQINQAANDLIWSLMQRLQKLEEKNATVPALQS